MPVHNPADFQEDELMLIMGEPDPLHVVHNLTSKHSSDPLWIQTQKVCQEVSDNFKPGSTEGLKYVYRSKSGGYVKVLLQFILMPCVHLLLHWSSLHVLHGSCMIPDAVVFCFFVLYSAGQLCRLHQ